MDFLKTNIQNACGTDDLRPHFKNVFFINGYAYASDCHILVRESLNFHGFDEEQIKLLNGKCISKDSFKYLKNIVRFEIKSDGIAVRMKSGIEIMVMFSDNSQIPEFEKIIPNTENFMFDHENLVLHFGPSVLKKLISCLESHSSTMSFYPNDNPGRPVLVSVDSNPWENRLMLIMRKLGE